MLSELEQRLLRGTLAEREVEAKRQGVFETWETKARRDREAVPMASRSGTNNGGRGGRDYRLNWKELPDGVWRFSDWSIRFHAQSPARPYTLYYRGSLMPLAGRRVGHRSFESVEAAKRWVEKYVEEHRKRAERYAPPRR